MEKETPVMPIVPKTDRMFQIGEKEVSTLFQALGTLPYAQVDPIIRYLKANLSEITDKKTNS